MRFILKFLVLFLSSFLGFQLLVASNAQELCPVPLNENVLILNSLDTCRNGVGNVYRIDVAINETVFRPKIRVCFYYPITYWVEHYLEPNNETCTSVKTEWTTTSFGSDLNLDSLYGSISSFAIRGQLAPYCDFSDEDSKKASFSYMNAVPQYSNFNQGNWRELEEAIRTMVNSNSLPAKVTTGTIGSQCTVGIRSLHFPQRLFKIVAFQDGSAQLFIGDNSDSETFEDFCDAVPGFGWPDVSKGRIYECAINDEILKRLGVEPEAIVYG